MCLSSAKHSRILPRYQPYCLLMLTNLLSLLKFWTNGVRRPHVVWSIKFWCGGPEGLCQIPGRTKTSSSSVFHVHRLGDKPFLKGRGMLAPLRLRGRKPTRRKAQDA